MSKAIKPPRVILQARTSSVRLPGKVLLPIGGMPLAILCAKRLARDGLDVVVATSTDSSDDLLSEAVTAFGIKSFRGSLDDVLQRFVAATSDMEEDQIVIRATADNPVPDAAFLRDLIEFLQDSGGVYATTGSPADGLPYGVSAEALRIKVLREAACHATDGVDREHVTPWIRRHHPIERIDRHRWGIADHSALRCTIDTFDDYQRVCQVFSSLEKDPVSASWLDIIEALSKAPGAPAFRIPFRHVGNTLNGVMTLGTVQLGMNYGISNRAGRPPEALAIKIIRHAIDHGVTCLDTARLYGDSEQRIGRALEGSWKSRVKVVTKLPAAPDLHPSCQSEMLKEWVDAQIYKSLNALQARQLDALMLHRWEDHDISNGVLWTRLLEHHDSGAIASLGASLYDPHQAIEALSDPNIRCIQIPFNILDRRWLEPKIQEHLKARSDVDIYVRSVFLQGLLLSEGYWWPRCDKKGHLSLNIVDEIVKDFGRSSRADLCIAYVRAFPWVTSLVLGVETLEQLESNLNLLNSSSPLSPSEIDIVHRRLPGAPKCVVDPSQWTL
jgi:spore coat polysaccharide biosynthesis protein SpsF (cytidylyltransferase family)/aryl-alcohol dehydrogenase-like predicted oxidoreductase